MANKKCIYDDFYEGILHLTILSIPVIIGVLGEFFSGSAVPISLFTSIIVAIYDARGIYKNKEYVTRIKIEESITLVLLFISLCFTMYTFIFNYNLQKGAEETLKLHYDIPIVLYIVSASSYLLETFYVFYCNHISEFMSTLKKGKDKNKQDKENMNKMDNEVNGFCAEFDESMLNNFTVIGKYMG